MTTMLPNDQVTVGAMNGGSIELTFPAIYNPSQLCLYAVGLWIKLDGTAGTVPILKTDQFFSLYAEGSSLVGSLNGTTTARNVLSANTWSWIVLCYNPYRSALELYVDNRLCQSAPAYYIASLSTCKMKLGPVNGLQIRTLAIWDFGQWNPGPSPDFSAAAWTNSEYSDQTVGFFNFSQVPAADTSGRGGTISYIGAAQQQSNTPGLDLTYGGYAEPINDTAVTLQNNFTIQAWIYPEVQTENGTIISSGRAGPSANFLRLQTNANTQQGVTYFNIGFRQQLAGTAPVIVASDFSIPANAWTNVAVVGTGKDIALYINGRWTKSGTLMANAVSSEPLLIGATVGETIGQSTNTFGGLIQSIAVWNKALTAADVEKFMYADAAADNNCLGYYHFSTIPAANDVTQNPVALVGPAEIYDRVISIQPTAEFLSYWARVGKQFAEPREYPVPVESRNIVAPPNVASAQQVEAAIDALVREYSALLPHTYSSAARAKMIAAHEAALRAASFANHDNTQFPVGVVRHAREGDRIVFYYRAPEGLYRVFDIENPKDACFLFKVQFVASLILGFIGCFGVPTSLTSIKKVGEVLEKALKNRAVLIAITSTLEGELTFRGACAVFTALYEQNLFGDVIKAAITGLGRWDAFFFVVTISITALELLFPNPSSAAVYAFYAAKFALLLAGIAIEWKGRPKGCMGQP